MVAKAGYGEQRDFMICWFLQLQIVFNYNIITFFKTKVKIVITHTIL